MTRLSRRLNCVPLKTALPAVRAGEGALLGEAPLSLID